MPLQIYSPAISESAFHSTPIPDQPATRRKRYAAQFGSESCSDFEFSARAFVMQAISVASSKPLLVRSLSLPSSSRYSYQQRDPDLRTIRVTSNMNNLVYHGLPVPVPYTLPYPIIGGPSVPTACTHTSYPRPDDLSSGPLATGRSPIRTINRKTSSLLNVVLLGLKRNVVRRAHLLEDCGRDYIDTLCSVKTARVARKELHL
jgi:hypothetical protein